MLVVLLLAVAVIVVGTVVVAVGRGGEMAEFRADVRPIDGDIATAADVVLLRPSVTFWGYDRRSTNEALNLVARSVTERDVEIATLRRQIADLQSARERPPIAQDPAAGPGAGEPAQPVGGWPPNADGGREPDERREPNGAPDEIGGLGEAAPSQAEPGAHAPPFARRRASPAPPPAAAEPWSDWGVPPEPGTFTEPGETG